MKHLLVFLGLKIAEVLVIVFLPYWIGSIPYIRKKSGSEYKIQRWGDGFFVIFVFLLFTMLVSLIVYLNWQWAGKLIGGGK